MRPERPAIQCEDTKICEEKSCKCKNTGNVGRLITCQSRRGDIETRLMSRPLAMLLRS